jgi:hypothetical protein
MSEKVFIQIDNEVIEAKGETLAYIQTWQADSQRESAESEQERLVKEAARKSALAKLAALGLTEAEIAAL